MAEVTEWGILFQAAMVRAIRAGQKTQTRRPLYALTKNLGRGTWDRRYSPPSATPPLYHRWTLSRWHKAKAGDLLWVRETWASIVDGPWQADHFIYAADGNEGWKHGWKPSIHMPRVACREEPTLTEVRIQRLHDISAEDALAEGIVQLPDGGYGLPGGSFYSYGDPANSYLQLWDAINGDAADNPWVVALSFKRNQQC